LAVQLILLYSFVKLTVAGMDAFEWRQFCPLWRLNFMV